MKGPIFIGGLMKSGTSLLRVLLAKHPNIFGGLETHWFSDDIIVDWKDSSSKRQRYLREFFDVNDSEFEKIKSEASDGVDFFDRFMLFCARRDSKNRWVEKTPDNILHISSIRKNWPDAKFIHVMRDLRDIYASWKSKKNMDIEAFLAKAHEVYAGLEGVVGRPDDFYLEINYNDLVLDTRRTIERVLNHIDEPWVDGLDSTSGDSGEFEKVLKITGKESATLSALKQPIFSSSIGQWEDILSQEESDRIERELAPFWAAVWQSRMAH